MAKNDSDVKTVVGIAVKHYFTSFSSSSPHHALTENFGESNTDITNWRPKASTVRAFLGSSNTKVKRFLYDFPEGKDDGSTVQTFLRSPGLDITEVETAEKIYTQIIEDKKRKGELTQAQESLLSDLKGIKDSLTASKSDPASNSDPASSSSSSASN